MIQCIYQLDDRSRVEGNVKCSHLAFDGVNDEMICVAGLFRQKAVDDWYDMCCVCSVYGIELT